jgi:TRAP-type C4-dicarboxylate transport system substrate-binding protein
MAKLKIMLLFGRVAKAFGKTPLQLAREYGFACDAFYDGLSPEDRIAIDHHIMNRLVEAENKAQEAMQKRHKEQYEHPGMERYENGLDFWDEVDAANKGED